MTAIVLQDDSDAQYHSFRGNVPVLAALVIIYLALKTSYKWLWSLTAWDTGGNHLYLAPFVLGFSAIFLFALHGTSVFKLLCIMSANYGIAKYFGGSKLNPLLTWIFNGVVLFTSELYSGYPFGSLHASLGLLVHAAIFSVFRALTFNLQIGRFPRNLSEMVYHLQHYHAETRVLQHGLLLGMFPLH